MSGVMGEKIKLKTARGKSALVPEIIVDNARASRPKSLGQRHEPCRVPYRTRQKLYFKYVCLTEELTQRSRLQT